jgi:hypothetical protein
LPTFNGSPTVIQNVNGILEVFICGSDGKLWHNKQVAPSSTNWSGWVTESIYSDVTGDPVVVQNDDGRLEVFFKGGPDNSLLHVWQKVTRDWSDGDALWAGAHLPSSSRPGVALNSNGTLEVFVRGKDDYLWHKYQTAKHGGANLDEWTRPIHIDTQNSVNIYSEPVAAINQNGRLEVFVAAAGRDLLHAFQSAPSSGPWSNWLTEFDFPRSKSLLVDTIPAVIMNQGGRLEVFMRKFLEDSTNPDQIVKEVLLDKTYQTNPAAGPWSKWEILASHDNYTGGPLLEGNPAVAMNYGGRLEVFCLQSPTVGHAYQTKPAAGPWSGWTSLVNPGSDAASDPAVH